MSSIYFHSIDDKAAALRGSERVYFGMLFSNITWAVLEFVAEDWGRERALLRKVFPPGHYAHNSANFPESAKQSLSIGSTPIILNGKEIEILPLVLNTAYTMGSDPIKLAARLHGQCEIYAYVKGENRQWLANIIRQGRKTKIFRDGMGWDSVIALLEESSDSPIVTSYSGCEQFPNYGYADTYTPYPRNGTEKAQGEWQDISEKWQDLPFAKRFGECFVNLEKSGGGLELKPDNWDSFYFRDGFDANQLVSKLYELYQD